MEKYYKEMLKNYRLDRMDTLVMEYETNIGNSHGQLSNESLKYFMSMFAYYAYALNAVLSRQSLKSDVAELYYEHCGATAYMASESEDGKKMTREEKQAVSKLSTEQEAKVKILYERVTQAIETRIKAFNRLVDTLNTLAALNMSEAKLGGRQ